MGLICLVLVDAFQGSDGAALTPHIEAFPFKLSIVKVGRAMSDMQSRIRIDGRFSKDLEDIEIVTDKRW